MRRESSYRRGTFRALVASAGAGVVALAAVALAPTSADAAISGSLYVNPSTGGAQWVAANPNDSRAAVIKGLVTTRPQAQWITNSNASSMLTQVSAYVSAAQAAGKVPQLVFYALPNRDCGGASAGGAADLNAYASWVSTVSQGLGKGTAIVLLEPDGLALQTCLSAAEVTARDNAISAAVTTIKTADPAAKVYLDGGHSAWNSASVQASRLQAAGVTKADGFFTNVSNFQTTSAETSFGQAIISALGNPSSVHQVIDTSRNGAGAGSGNWCDDSLPSTRRIGQAPTLSTGTSTVDAYLWVKLPGEADGCLYTPGQFLPANAYSLAGSGTVQPPATPSATPTVTPTATPTVTPSATPSVTPTATRTPTPTPTPTGTPAAGCSATYSVSSQWSNGFQGNVTVTAGRSISGWKVTWTLPSGQAIAQAWSATVATSGSAVTATNLAWNGTLSSGASTAFGFIGSGSGSAVPAVTCTAS